VSDVTTEAAVGEFDDETVFCVMNTSASARGDPVLVITSTSIELEIERGAVGGD
jgi:hypothetical protein